MGQLGDFEGPAEVDAVVDALTTALEVVSAQLSTQVLENHDKFLEGLGTIAEVEGDLQQAHVVSVNARINLKFAQEEVRTSLRIAERTQQKKMYEDVLEVLMKLQWISHMKADLQGAQEQGEYMEAFMLCAECFDALESMGDVQFAVQLKAGIHGMYMETVDRLDSSLRAVCNDFEDMEYQKILGGFMFLGTSVQEICDKILHCYQELVNGHATKVVRSVLATTPSLANAAVTTDWDVPFAEVAKSVPFHLLRPCLSKLLEILFGVLQSYHRMDVWHESVLREGGLSGIQNGVQKQAFAEPPEEAPTDSSEVPSNSIGQEFPEGSSRDLEAMEEAQREALAVVHATLGQSSKLVWESCARRVRDLLNGPSAFEGEHFLQVMELCQRFSAVGEAFIGSESETLRSTITEHCGRFFDSYHRASMEALGQLLRSEQFVDISGPGDEGGRVSLAGSAPHEAKVAADFDMLVERGNPFRLGGPVWEDGQEEPAELWEDKIDEDGGGERMGQSSSEPGQPSGSSSQGCLTNSARKILKWMSNYVTLMRPLRFRAGDVFGGMCDLFDAYLLEVFLFAGGMSLEELVWEQELTTTRLQSTLLRILTREGSRHRDEVERVRASKPNKVSTTATSGGKFAAELKNFARVFNMDKTSSQAAGVANGLGGGSAPDTPSRGGRTPTSGSVDRSFLMASTNLFGLRETVTAVGSLETLAIELQSARGMLHGLLPPESARVMDSYYSRTVDATQDLKECAFGNAARRLLNQVLDPSRGTAVQVASTSYDKDDPSVSHASWAHILGEHIGRFSEVLNYSGLPKGVVGKLWEHAMAVVAEVVVDGLSRVEKCSMAGRSMMSVDLSHLENSFRLHVPDGVQVNLRAVDTYIKAFYLPWEDLPKWAATHQAEYGRTKILALVNLIAERLVTVEHRQLKRGDIRAMTQQVEAQIDQFMA
ncbi:unnamed protein product [Ostreobium quekettii]|uniref:Uncharacterized protein n=1 Tax=Ostreobium quekettii TaxID=121088 RepID=A0A8S1J1W2_9CHLO|nr:unnamed protein product [Ostreobium quekettii]|eukprot:evm.model.scf_386.6 EVM.evm.TU.scf_386.6   scf_386:59097-67942(+)